MHARRHALQFCRRLSPLLLAAGLAFGCGGSVPESERANGQPTPDELGHGDLVEGFLVWESDRSGAWRIWTRDLAGGGPRQLTADESSRQHCCPHISPDGRWVAYLSLEGVAGYAAGGSLGELRLVRPDGSEQRSLAARARTLFENRAVVWRSPSELIYIRGDLGTMLLDLDQGSARELTRPQGEDRAPLLVSGALAHAVTGQVDFSPFDPETRAVSRRNRLHGCQPYFSGDGRWGFWTAGTGGPVKRIHLATGAISTVLEKSDPRIPDGLGYVYFPMFSRDGRLFAFAGSDYDHAHFEADYEIFVAESDPETLELTGSARRMTRHPATDRFPDVHLDTLELGRHRGEVPLRVELRPDFERSPGSVWHFDFGDGERQTGAAAEHTFERPGRFRIEATAAGSDDGPTLRGHVVALPASPPRATSVSLRDQGATLVVGFDEDVWSEAPGIRFESGRSVADWTIGSDRRTLVIVPSEPVREFDRLTLDGVADTAQERNWMATATLEIEPPTWPSDRSELVFLWETANQPNLVPDPSTGTERAGLLTARRGARLDHDFAMALGPGHFAASAEDAQRLFERCTATNRCSVEATLTPASTDSRELLPVISFSDGSPRGRNFVLGQRRDRLLFAPRAGSRGATALPEIDLGPLQAGRPTHVVASHESGRLEAFVDGEPVVQQAVPGGFFHWRPRPLLMGASPRSGAGWAGKLEGVALYSRFVGAAEARENFARYRSVLEARPEVEAFELSGTLIARSETPTLAEISPYREALAVFEYRTERAVASRDRVRVARWVILDGEPTGAADGGLGQTAELTIEPFTDNPQLEGTYLSDSLPPYAGPLYYAVDP